MDKAFSGGTEAILMVAEVLATERQTPITTGILLEALVADFLSLPARTLRALGMPEPKDIPSNEPGEIGHLSQQAQEALEKSFEDRRKGLIDQTDLCLSLIDGTSSAGEFVQNAGITKSAFQIASGRIKTSKTEVLLPAPERSDESEHLDDESQRDLLEVSKEALQESVLTLQEVCASNLLPSELEELLRSGIIVGLAGWLIPSKSPGPSGFKPSNFRCQTSLATLATALHGLYRTGLSEKTVHLAQGKCRQMLVSAILLHDRLVLARTGP